MAADQYQVTPYKFIDRNGAMAMWDEPLAPSALDGGPAPDERVLVVVITRLCDWETVQAEHWYRIPVSRAPRRIGAEYLAFYHTRDFGPLRWSIAYYAPIRRYRLWHRRDLVPDEPDHPRAGELYYKIELGPLAALPHPIPSRKLRRVTFIQTTLARLLQAEEINDLWEREVPRDRLWRALHLREIPAQCDYAVQEGSWAYIADLAVFCVQCNLAIACVQAGETQLAEERAAYDPQEQMLYAHGWVRQRFSAAEIMEDLHSCAETVCRLVAANGGLRA